MRLIFTARYLKIWITTLIFSLSIAVSAQVKLNCRVVEETNNDPVPEALVQTRWGHFFTDGRGEVQLELNAKQLSAALEIQLVASGNLMKQELISPVQVNTLVKENKVLLLVLKPSKQLLDQVLVTGSRNQELVLNSKASVELVKPYLLQNKGVTNMDRFISQIPSVSLIDGQANIRSGSGWTYGAGSRVLVLVDDLPFLTGDAGQVKWGFVPIESIEQIEVIKGASSVLYGSSALNGILHFRTELASQGPVTRYQISSGVFENPARKELKWTNQTLMRNNLSFFHSNRKGNHRYAISSNYLDDDGYRLGESERRIRTGFRYQYQKENLIFGLAGSVYGSRNSSFLLWESYKMGYTILDSQQTITNSFSWNLDPSIRYLKGNTLHQIRLRLMGVSNNLDNLPGQPSQDNAFTNAYAEYQADRQVTPELRILGGLVWATNASRADLYGGGNTSENRAGFLQADWKRKKLALTLGGRFEWFSMNGAVESSPVFRVAGTYQVNKAGMIRSSWGQGFRFPTIAERYISTRVGALNVFSNPYLKPEKGWSAELGYKQGFRLGALSGFADVALFHTVYDDMMEFNFGYWNTSNFNQFASGLGFKSFNIGRTRISGMDFSLGFEGKTGTIKWQGLVGYTYSLPIAVDPNQVFAFDSVLGNQNFRSTRSDSLAILKYRYEHQFKADVQAGWRRWECGLSFRYDSRIRNVDRAFVYSALVFFVPGIADARKELGSSRLLDFRMAYLVSDALKISLIVNNVSNQLVMRRPADLGPPRMWMIQFSGRF
ncbi:hypothetical protein MASR2M44_29100 [Bacteroidota bacterium]